MPFILTWCCASTEINVTTADVINHRCYYARKNAWAGLTLGLTTATTEGNTLCSYCDQIELCTANEATKIRFNIIILQVGYGVSNHLHFDCILLVQAEKNMIRIIAPLRRESIGKWKFPQQRANDAESFSMSWQTSSMIVYNLQPHDCLHNRLFRRKSKETRNSPVPGESPAQRASNAENVSIWWRHHGYFILHWI